MKFKVRSLKFKKQQATANEFKVTSLKFKAKTLNLKLKTYFTPLFFILFLASSILPLPSDVLFADTPTQRVHVTVLLASNEGSDFDLENDAYRDQLLNLFSYTAYKQEDKFFVDLEKSQREYITLPGGYELMLTLQDVDKDRIHVQAFIRKEEKQYLDTSLSIRDPGVIFVGGPPVDNGVLILVLETGY